MNMPAHDSKQEKRVKVTIDGHVIEVPEGINLIEAAKYAHTEIPHYCYHPDLSVAGNCRMCQVEVVGMPKLTIGCNTIVREGMEFNTHVSSKKVADAQASTLEFILINHPLDCTVCDQAGHCKLQDYHYEYNARPSRFLEEKEHKPKAVELGPEIMFDGERCILCTRCVRFCDEVTETSELGVLNRGDKSLISVNEGRELNNALSGTVVDLCPVGALTHKRWRFNSRIWFTSKTDSICPGCSTGCNVEVYERDGKVVQVKARYNSEVNKEWLCNAGRYGLGDFLPSEQITGFATKKGPILGDEFVKKLGSAISNNSSRLLLVASSDLLVGEYMVLASLARNNSNISLVNVTSERTLLPEEGKLVAPDRDPNKEGALLAGFSAVAAHDLQTFVQSGRFDGLVIVGDLPETLDFPNVFGQIGQIFGLLSDRTSKLAEWVFCEGEDSIEWFISGVPSIVGKSGFFINKNQRLQQLNQSVKPIHGTNNLIRLLIAVAESIGISYESFQTIHEYSSDREVLKASLSLIPNLEAVSLKEVTGSGVDVSYLFSEDQ